MTNRDLDVIIFGASGFTGKYAVYESVKLLKNFKWGVAGRSKSKLEAVLQEMGEKAGTDLTATPIIIADVDNPDSMRQMAERCRVIINCTGPYRLWGEPVVKACVEAGTHQVDVTGEPQYMERMVIEYNDKAKETGSYIVSSCGFDSIPADMGVVFMEQHFDGVLNSVEQYLTTNTSEVKTKGAIIHYGTWASLVHGVAHWSELKNIRKKLFKGPLPKFEPKLKSRGVVHKSEQLNKFCLPFLGSDQSVVYRSQRYFYDTEEKRPIQHKAYFAVQSFIEVIGFIIFGLMVGLMANFNFGRKLLLKYPECFTFGKVSHAGPSEEMMEKSKFTMHLFGKGWPSTIKVPTGDEYILPPNKEIYVQVNGTNPGYGATCVALVLSAVTLLKDKDKLPATGGVYTTAAAFTKTNLIKALNDNGLTFEVVSAREEPKKDE